MKPWLKAVLITAGAVAAAAAAVAVLTAPGAADEEKKSTIYGRNVAHRGLHDRSGMRPENSLSAFRAAAKAGYGAEMDARLTADDVPVILHDENTLRMCGEDKEVAETSFAELRELRLGDSDEHIPTLDEALEAVDGSGPVILELKSAGEKNDILCEKALEAIREYDGAICVESFDPRIVAWFRKNAPDILRGQLTNSFKELRDESTPLLTAFALSNGLTNVMARPHFIAHGSGKKSPLLRVSELLGAMPVYWTSHSASKQKENDAVIFEYYRPLAQYK